jgi:sugar phosphate isomerase/epimerase
MKFGICFGGIGPKNDQLLIAHDCGFDYVELSMVDIMTASENELFQLKQTLTRNQLKCPISYVFFPWQMKIVGPTVDRENIARYIQLAVQRASHLGITKLVIGSGTSRSVPPGFNKEKALEQFCFVIHEIQTVSQESMVTVIEPMCCEETNLLNTVNEVTSQIAEMKLSSVKTMLDLFHYKKNNECFGELIGDPNMIEHIHLSTSIRTFPKKKEDMEDLFYYLHSINYKKTVSIEASTSNFGTDARCTLQLIKNMEW